MNEKLVDYLIDKTDQLGSFISEIAKQMGVAATHVYEILIRQQYVEGIGFLIWSIGLLILISFIAYCLKKGIISRATWHEFVVIPYIVCLFLFIVFIGCFYEGVLRMMNPEYYALQDLFEMIEAISGKDVNNDGQ